MELCAFNLEYLNTIMGVNQLNLFVKFKLYFLGNINVIFVMRLMYGSAEPMVG